MSAAIEGWVVALSLWLGLGCSSTPRVPETDTDRVPEDIVMRSSLPLSFVWQSRELTLPELLSALDSARAVCIGENHDNPHHHFAQWELSKALAARSQRPFAVGFEMFQVQFQGTLDAYSRGGDARTLREHSHFEDRWGHPFAYYAPILDSARSSGARLLALNARRELSKAVSRQGVSGLSVELLAELPELDQRDPEHRAFFERAMGMQFESSTAQANSTHGGLSLDNLYAAQLVWDETMAQTGARWLTENPGGRLVVIAGSGHCHQSAVPRRIERRGHGSVAARAILRSELGHDMAPADSEFELLVVLEDGPAKGSQTTGSEM